MGAVERERLDRLLVRRGLAATRAQAAALVLAGRVFSGERRLDKPGVRYPLDQPLDVREGPRWVGRGGTKLAAAIERLAIEVAGREALDVGASTGGFTDVLLAHGARRVVALDVGRGQLDWSLRRDERVVPLEGVNARWLEPSMLPWPPALAVVDVSFISLTLVLPAVVRCLAPGGVIVALVKPQFEVGRGGVGRGGIVRDAASWRRVLEAITAFVGQNDWGILGVMVSPLRGAEGNVEFFVALAPDRPGLDAATLAASIEAALAEAADEREP
jgi:23S rRNA (cytidine1920-2'-O)/16S rRNA (cytidine1409-2'-O)-methyltransferase